MPSAFDELLAEPWLPWAVGLVVGFPLLTVALAEAGERLGGRHAAAGPLVGGLRRVVLPLLAAYLFLTRLLGYGADHIAVRVTYTALLVGVLYAGLFLADAVLFSTAERGSWRSRVPKLFLDLTRAFLILLGTGLIASVVWGADLGGFLAALGVGSIVLGLALQDTLGNLMSGIAILFERPFGVGSWVRVDGDTSVEGRVTEMNWRSVRLLTRENDLLVVPNLSLAGSTLRVFDKPRSLHLERIAVGFSYSDPPGRVRAVLLGLAADVPAVLTDPAPEVFTLGYDDSSIGYELRVWTDDYAGVPRLRDAVMSRVWYAARRGGLTIPFPLRTVLNYDGPAVDAAERPPVTPALLRTATAFATLPDDTLDGLAAHARTQRFAAGESITAVGDDCRTLYLILEGTAELYLPPAGAAGSNPAAREADEPDAVRIVGRLSRGDFFGAIALLTDGGGSLSTRSVTELRTAAIDSAAVRAMLDHDRPLAREFAALVETRRDAVRRVRAVAAS